MTDDDFKRSIERRQSAIEADVVVLNRSLNALSTAQSVTNVRYEQIKSDLDSIRKILNWIAVMALGGFGAAFINWVISGGLASVS